MAAEPRAAAQRVLTARRFLTWHACKEACNDFPRKYRVGTISENLRKLQIEISENLQEQTLHSATEAFVIKHPICVAFGLLASWAGSGVMQ
eukprot:1605234-Pleurochrysis_carterae.AAC.1